MEMQQARWINDLCADDFTTGAIRARDKLRAKHGAALAISFFLTRGLV